MNVKTIKGIDNIIEWLEQNGGTLPKGSRLIIFGRDLIPCTEEHIVITSKDNIDNE